MTSISNDIPAEFVMRYVGKERDHYKNRLEQVSQYAKDMETFVNAMKEALGASSWAEMQDKIKQLQAENKSLKNSNQVLQEFLSNKNEKIERMAHEMTLLKNDYIKSDWYKKMCEKAQQRDNEYKRLKAGLNKLVASKAIDELIQL